MQATAGIKVQTVGTPPPPPPPPPVSSWYDAGYRLDGTKAEAAGGVDITDASDAPGTKVTIKAPGGAKSAVGAKAPPFSALASPQPAFDADATTHEALIDAIGGECGTERMMRSVLCGWKDEASKVETIERLAEFEDDFSGAPEGMSVKEALVGTWKLLVTSEADGVVGGGGLTASATPPYGRLVAQYQSFRLPTADDVLSGNVFFLETNEVAVDVKEGVSSTATAKGGFSVKPSEGAPGYFDVLEEYSSLELAQGGGAKVGGTGTLDSNRWSCVFLSPELRICRLPDGSRRTYAKVEPALAAEELARLATLSVAVDPKAVADFEASEKLKKALAAAEAAKKPKKPINPMEDPNDDRPMYIKREAWENMNGQGRGFGGGVRDDKFGPIAG